jgi:hypothetical protein
MRPRSLPSEPTLVLFSFSWLSIRVALAGKMAGKARKRPPKPGPNFLAINPATTVAKPPNRNRIKYSCALISLREEKSTPILVMPASGRPAIGQLRRQTRAGTMQEWLPAHLAYSAEAPNQRKTRTQKADSTQHHRVKLKGSVSFSILAYGECQRAPGAIDGAAPKSPAKLLGRRTSLSAAKKLTTNPPTINRIKSVSIGLCRLMSFLDE